MNRELMQRISGWLNLCNWPAGHVAQGFAAELRAALAAPVAPAGDKPATSEPITVEAVATVIRHEEEGLVLDWLIEGGICALCPGQVLVAATRTITDGDGAGEVYTAPPDVQRDAERYRWLRDVSVPPHNFYLSVPIEFDGVKYGKSEVDAYIDAAMAAEVDKLQSEIENLHSVMVAAAEEIHEHWQAHCDEDGYGPANLMHRLEKGIPAEYAYKAGDFERLMKERDAAVARLDAAKFKFGDRVRKVKGSKWQGLVVGVYSTALMPEGYAVESEVHAGSVQIYPVSALELVP